MCQRCRICQKRVLSHSCYLRCIICKSVIHIVCLGISKADTLYEKRDSNGWICIKCMADNLPFNHIEEEDEFRSALSDNIIRNLSLDDLNENLFNPLDLNIECNDPLLEHDPDIHFYNEVQSNSTCSYHSEDSFVKMCKNAEIISDNFSMIHCNIRSLPKNLDSFAHLLNNLELQFSLIGLSETWLNDTKAELYNLPGYRHLYKYRSQRTGGGVSLFIKNSLKIIPRDDLSFFNDNMESLFVEIDKDQLSVDRNLIIGVIYRPPNTDISVFNNLIDNIMCTIRNEKKVCYLAGDYNINLLNIENHALSHEFIECMYSYSYLPLITKPTRVTADNATLIDNIFVNNMSNMSMYQGIICTDISDHFPVFLINRNVKSVLSDTSVCKRNYCKKNLDKFVTKLGSVDWDELLEMNDCQSAFTCFHTRFSQVYNECFPLQNLKTTYRNRKIWLTEGLRTSIKLKNKLYIKSIKYPLLHNVKQYRIYRNKLHQLLRKAEREHYDSLFTQHKANLRKSWAIIKEVINKKKSCTMSSKFLINGKITTDKSVIANHFNEFYVNVGPNLSKDIPLHNISVDSYIKKCITDTMYLNPCTVDEVRNIIIALKDASAGYDEITSKVVKLSAPNFIVPLTHILNLSLEQGTVPDEMKIAKVLPLFKGGDQVNVTNYRPVSVLPVFSKILEKIMYNRLLSFCEKHSILYDYQFGFRANHSTNMALILIVDKILQALKDGHVVLGLFWILVKHLTRLIIIFY